LAAGVGCLPVGRWINLRFLEQQLRRAPDEIACLVGANTWNVDDDTVRTLPRHFGFGETERVHPAFVDPLGSFHGRVEVALVVARRRVGLHHCARAATQVETQSHARSVKVTDAEPLTVRQRNEARQVAAGVAGPDHVHRKCKQHYDGR